MSQQLLDGGDLCAFFESMSEGRRELVWARCERLLGAPLTELADDAEGADAAFDRVLTDMWCSDQLERLVELGRLHRGVASDGSLVYSSDRL